MQRKHVPVIHKSDVTRMLPMLCKDPFSVHPVPMLAFISFSLVSPQRQSADLTTRNASSPDIIAAWSPPHQELTASAQPFLLPLL